MHFDKSTSFRLGHQRRGLELHFGCRVACIVPLWPWSRNPCMTEWNSTKKLRSQTKSTVDEMIFSVCVWRNVVCHNKLMWIKFNCRFTVFVLSNVQWQVWPTTIINLLHFRLTLNLYLYTRYAPPAATASPIIMTQTAVHADLTSVAAFLPANWESR